MYSKIKACADAYRHPAQCTHGFVQTEPLSLELLLPTAAKMKQKMPLEGNALIQQLLQFRCRAFSRG